MSESEYAKERLDWESIGSTWAGEFTGSAYTFLITPFKDTGRFQLTGFMNGEALYMYVYETPEEAQAKALPLVVEWLELELGAMKTYLEEQKGAGKVTGPSSPWG